MKPFCTFLSLFACPALAAADFEAGAAKVDITPDEPVRLSGYGARTTVHEGVDDPLFVRALALRDAAGVISVLVSVDAIGIPASLRERVVGAIRGRTGIYHVRLAIAATHSHYAPVLDGCLPNLFEMTPEEAAAARRYTERVTKRIVQAIDGALGRIAPASIGYAKGTAGFAANRRTAGGPTDHDVPVLAVRGDDGKPVAIAFGYACHATTMQASVNRVSGDWPGAAAAGIETAFPGAVALPVIGCGADQNPEPRGTLALSREYGDALATEVTRVVRGQMKSLPPSIDASFEYVPLRFARVPTAAELRERLERGPAHVQRLARTLLARLDAGQSIAESYTYPVQVWSFGEDLWWVFLAGEVVVDYAHRLRRELGPRETWVAAYTNDAPGYIPSRRVLAEGGYEADDSMVWYGQPSRWDPSIEDAIVEKVKSLAPRGVDEVAARVRPPPPKEPREALALFRVAAGLQVELAAAEPDITDPVQIAFDEDGRMYAAEMRDYPLGPAAGKPFDGRVRVLEDRDLDGYYEHSRILADDLPYPNGIACSRGGVFVTAVPDILYLKDEDGDGRAEIRRTVYSGFRPGNSQHLLSYLQHGPDNWIHVGGGDAATVRWLADPSPVPPGWRRPEPLPLLHANFRFHPLTLALEPVSGYRGGFGIAFDERGSRFVCDNQTHAVHVVLERDALEAAGEIEVEDTMAEISAHGAGVFPASRVLERFNDPLDYGRFSSACGVHVYAGDNLPPEYRGNLISCEPVSNLVHRDVLLPTGATYAARRVDVEAELLASSDHWFRPVSAATGPDGALYIVDMYRQVIEHPEWIPAHQQKLLDLKGGMDRGRIWRLTGAPVRRREPELGRTTARELAVNLAHPNAWRRQTAQRLLCEGRHEDAAGAVKELIAERPGPLGILHALWTLDGLDALEPAVLDDALTHPYPAVRAQAARLCARRGLALPGLARLADDIDPPVRFQVAFALRSLPAAGREPALRRIARLDAGDPWTRTALLASSDDLTGLAAAVLEDGQLDPGPESFIVAALRRAGRSKDPARRVRALGFVLEARPDGELPAWRTAALASLLEAMGDAGLEEALRAVSPDEASRLRDGLHRLFARVAERARGDATVLPDRLAALELAAHDGAPETAARLASFLEPRYPGDLQGAAVRALGRSSRPDAIPALLAALPRLGPRVRGAAIDACLREEARALALLAAIEDGVLAAGEIDLPRRKALLEHPAAAVRERAAQLLAAVAASPDRATVVERYRAALAAAGAGDAARGEPLYQKVCSVCHRHGDAGHAVGPDLTAMRQREPDALLADILDPNRAVAPELVAYACVKTDGQVVTGILAAETPGNIVLRGQEGKSESIPRRDIAELKSSGKSLMPDGLEQELTPEQLRDVIAFVRGGAPAIDFARLRASLTFHAGFDGTADAAFARGDRRAYTGGMLGKDVRPGLTTGNAAIAGGKGRFGDAIAWTAADEQFVQYRGMGNVAYAPRNWSGTVAFWMSLDPEKDLPPAYSDPLHITERAWNDGALFIDFSKDDAPRHLRLGAFADREVWDPGKREWEQVAAAERPMVDVARPPFARGRWTHVALTWASFNSGRADGIARLYLDGEPAGDLAGRRQSFTWDPARVWIHIGMTYVGLLDDLALFDRALTEGEVRALYRLDGGIASLGVK